MDVNYWQCLNSLSLVNTFKEQAEIFRYFAHLEACCRIETLVQRYVNEFKAKLILNPFLTVEKYNLQCQHMVTVFLFQPPLFMCKTSDERKYVNELFANWNPNSYCIDFYQKLKHALNIKLWQKN